MKENLLLVSYHFPPDAAVGALRSQKFVKYLPENGWHPFVLTLKEHYYQVLDPGRLNDVGGVTIYRTAYWRTPLRLFFDIRDRYIRGKNGLKENHENEPENEDIRDGRSSLKGLVAGLNSLPDEYLFWLIPGFAEGMKAIRRHGIRQILVSAPPHSSLVLAFCLASATDAKLVIDFRDPWEISQGGNRGLKRPDFLKSLERSLQIRIYGRASAILTTNRFFKEAFLRDNPFVDEKRVHVVHNGFDRDDFNASSVGKKNGKYVISYLGTFYLKRTPEVFLRALARFMNNNGLDDRQVEVNLVGQTETACGSPVGRLIVRSGLENVVKLVGKVPYEKAIDMMCRSDLLLLFAPEQPCQIPAKTYEYMATGKPILAVADPGATSSLIEENGAGICVHPDNEEAMCLALHHLYEDYLKGSGNYRCDPSLFERRRQAEQLSGILREI